MGYALSLNIRFNELHVRFSDMFEFFNLAILLISSPRYIKCFILHFKSHRMCVSKNKNVEVS